MKWGTNHDTEKMNWNKQTKKSDLIESNSMEFQLKRIFFRWRQSSITSIIWSWSTASSYSTTTDKVARIKHNGKESEGNWCEKHEMAKEMSLPGVKKKGKHMNHDGRSGGEISTPHTATKN